MLTGQLYLVTVIGLLIGNFAAGDDRGSPRPRSVSLGRRVRSGDALTNGACAG